jgi:hypothetical protein
MIMKEISHILAAIGGDKGIREKGRTGKQFRKLPYSVCES